MSEPYSYAASHAPVSWQGNQGYDVVSTRLNKGRRDTALKRANGRLDDGSHYIDLFVTGVNIGISQAGSTAQSHLTRDFYPHNMIMPTFNITGQALNQEDYADLTEFVHQAQRKGVFNGTLLTLTVAGSAFKPLRPIMRGRRKPIHAQGFVNTMPRRHQRHVYAPTFTFGFIVSTMIDGIYRETAAENPGQQSWSDIMKHLAQSNPTVQPLFNTTPKTPQAATAPTLPGNVGSLGVGPQGIAGLG